MTGFRVRAEKCDQCLFTPQRIVSGQRMAEVLKACSDEGKHFTCHKHDDVCCRGFYDHQPQPWYSQVAKRLGMIEWVGADGAPVPSKEGGNHGN